MKARALLWALIYVTVTAGTAVAQNFPERPIRLVVGSAPGGGNDFVARVMNARLSDFLGEQVVIDNRGGVGGLLASDLVARSNPDGYTLLQMFSNFVILPSLHEKLPFDVIRDFAPVANLASSPLVLVVHPSLPANSVSELVKLAQSKPHSLNYAAPGVGSLGHLTAELFKSMAKVEMEHIAYKGGGPAITALVANQVNLYFSTLPAALGQVKANRLRALGVTSGKRSSVAPEVPTIAEQGLKGFEVVGWFGMFAPAKTPPAAIRALNASVNKTLALEETRGRMLASGVEAEGGTPEAFARQVREDLQKWSGVAKQAGLKK
jgi:tripartite-type tricarboxylate transporter receptor subunit TctC